METGFVRLTQAGNAISTSSGLSAGSRDLGKALDPADKPRDVKGEKLKISPTETITNLFSQPPEKTIVCIAPGIEILSIEKNLPNLPKNKLLAAIPFAIEDQLLDMPDAYHYIVADKAENGKTSILAVKNTSLQQWLDTLKQKNIYCTMMLPDYLLVPYQAHTWNIYLEETALVRLNRYQGFTCDIEFLPDMLSFHLNQCSEEARPHTIVMHHALSTLPWPESRLSALGVLIEVQPLTESLFITMTKNFDSDLISANLLQDKFAQKQHLSNLKKLWLLAGGLAATAIVVSFLSTVIEFSILKHRDSVLQQNIATVYQRIYPNATSVVSPELRITRTLKDLQAHQTGGGYLGLLALAGNIIHKNPDVQLTDLRYQDNKLIVDITAANFSILNKIVKQWNQAGIQTHQDQASAQEGNKVTARFTLQGDKHESKMG